MNEFELFTMIFYAVDAYCDDNPTNELKAFLGQMSPFTFKGIDSADSAVFSDFRSFINHQTITVENSLKYAVDYAKTVECCNITDAFDGITDEQWRLACADYLSKPHKGENYPEE